MAPDRPALIYTPDFTRHETGEISFRGPDLVHHIAGQELVDPVYTVAKLAYPYPVTGRLPNPEQAARVANAYETLQAFGLVGDRPDQLRLVKPFPAEQFRLATVHSANYIRQVTELSKTGGELAESTYLGVNSFEWAALAAGAGLRATELVLNGQAPSAFALLRPPGHHAARDHAAGFCIFNNVAVAAAYCKERGRRRVMIVDWDLHHGDGTQEIFYDDPAVLFCSLHQFGPELYPEKGSFEETGAGPGRGYSVNLPLPAKTSEASYLALFRRVIPALAESFRPDIILVSAGYDGHFNDTQNPYVYDPGGGLGLTAQTYAELTRLVAQTADRHCEGRYVIFLEGGYNLYNLAAGVVNTVAAMLGLPTLITETLPPAVEVPPPDTEAYLDKLRQIHPQFKF